MAYLPQTEEEQNQQQGQEQSATQEQVIASEPQSAPSGGAGASAAPKPNQPSSSGAFTNLNRYVTANRGNDAQMGRAAQAHVGKAAAGAQQAGQQFATGATDTINAGTFNDATANSVVQAVKTNPTKVTAKQVNQGYAGPQTADELTGTTDAVGAKSSFQNVQDTAKSLASGDISERGTVIQDIYGNRGDGRYTQGEGLLDSFILGTGAGGQQAVHGINNTYGNFSSEYDKILGNLNNLITGAKKTSDANAGKVKDAVSTAYDSALQGVQAGGQKAAQMSSQQNQKFHQTVSSAMADGRIDKSEGAALGVDPAQANAYIASGGKLTDIVDFGGGYQMEDFVSPEQFAAYQHLAKLAGAKAPISKYNKNNVGGPKQLLSTDIQALEQYLAANPGVVERKPGKTMDESANEILDAMKSVTKLPDVPNPFKGLLDTSGDDDDGSLFNPMSYIS